MKKLFVFTLLVFLSSSVTVIGQCDSEGLSSTCIPKLAGGFNFLKSYKIDGLGGSKDKDTIENLMGLCRKCHIEYGDKKQYKEFLKDIHAKNYGKD